MIFGLRMISTAATRRFSPWLVGLFLIAQIFGVVCLVSEHTVHEAEVELALAVDNGGSANIPQHHHRGDADGFVQHHELQDLSGTFNCTVSWCEIGLVGMAIAPNEPNALVAADPTRLERPPKSLLSL